MLTILPPAVFHFSHMTADKRRRDLFLTVLFARKFYNFRLFEAIK